MKLLLAPTTLLKIVKEYKWRERGSNVVCVEKSTYTLYLYMLRSVWHMVK